MSVDIGPRIGIDGEAEFRKEINALTQQVKTYGSQMKAVTSEFEKNEDSVEALNAKNTILGKTIEAQSKKLAELKKGLSEAERLYGSNDTKTLRWEQAVHEATSALNKMESEVKSNNDAISRLESGVDDIADSMDDAGKSASDFGDMLKSHLAADAIIGSVKEIAGGLKEMSEESREYRKIMGSLEVSSEKAGYTAEETKQTYKELYAVLADNQTAATTTANLQAINLEQEKLNQMVDGAIGAWATYGDSIPIDGLAEAINETVKTATVTGNFADVINWAGSNEDDFNAKLQAASSETERANIVLQELADQGLIAAGQAWQENNKSLVEANQATADYEAATAKIGETVEPILTAVTQNTTKLLNFLIENKEAAIAVIAGIGAGFLTWNVASMLAGTSSALGALKAAVLGVNAAMAANPIGVVITLLSAVAVALGTFLATNEEAREKLGQIWSEIKETFSAALSNVSTAISSGLSNIKTSFTNNLNSIKNSVETTWNNVKSDTVAKWNSITTSTVTAVTNMRSSVSSGMKNVANSIKSGLESATNYVKGLPSKFLSWGRDMISNLVSGIKQKVGAVKEAINDVADTIRSYIHFSEPDVGPLSDFHTYMPDMAKMLITGIRDGIPDIKSAMNDMTSVMVPTYANGTAAAYDRMAANLGNLQVVLDDGTLVGKIAPKIDTVMGGYVTGKGRYNV